MTSRPSRRFQQRTNRDGRRYGLTAERDADGYLHLIANPGRYEYDAGLVADAANFEAACDAADEEIASLIAEARAEFGG